MNNHANLRIGVVGIGVMGFPIATHLLESGFQVTVRDIRKEPMAAAVAAGLITADSPAALATAVDVVIVIVVDKAQIDTVLFGDDGVVHRARVGERMPPLTVLLCSTIAPEDVVRCASRLANYGIETLDAPVSGGPIRALTGSISMMLAGPTVTLERAASLTKAMADKRFIVSMQVGDAARVKLVNNLLAGANLVAAAEAMALGARLGLDGQMLFEVINQSSGASWIFSDRMARVLRHDFVPRAALTLLTKDLTLATAMAASVCQPTPVADAALTMFRRAVKEHDSALDDAAVIKVYEVPPRD